MSATLPDCTVCHGPRGVDVDGESAAIVCLAGCRVESKVPPALPAAEWRRRVAVVRGMAVRGELDAQA